MWFSINHAACIIRGASHCGLAICIKKYLKAKERIMETQIFHHAKIWSSKYPPEETKSFNML
jgi:hypothetical protein